MSNKASSKLWVRIACIILAGLMVVGVATTAIFMIFDAIKHATENDDHDDHEGHNHAAAYEQIALPEYDALWRV